VQKATSSDCALCQDAKWLLWLHTYHTVPSSARRISRLWRAAGRVRGCLAGEYALVKHRFAWRRCPACTACTRAAALNSGDAHNRAGQCQPLHRSGGDSVGLRLADLGVSCACRNGCAPRRQQVNQGLFHPHPFPLPSRERAVHPHPFPLPRHRRASIEGEGVIKQPLIPMGRTEG